MIPWLWFTEDLQYWPWALLFFCLALLGGLIYLIISLARRDIDLFEVTIAGVMDGEVYHDSTLGGIGMYIAVSAVGALLWPLALIALPGWVIVEIISAAKYRKSERERYAAIDRRRALQSQ